MNKDIKNYRKMKKPILCLDFDGVIHSYTSDWKGADIILDPPVTGAFDFIIAAAKYFDIQIYSSRSSQPGGIEAMKVWFDYHWCIYNNLDYETTEMNQEGHILSYLKFPIQKPNAFLTIDDRSITFNGSWPIVEELLSFKPWNKK